MKSKIGTEVTQDLSKDVKDFKKKFKSFKSVQKKDLPKSLDIAKELIEMINKFRTSKDAKVKKLFPQSKLDKLQDSFDLYIDNVTNLLNYKAKYDEKKGVNK